MRKIYFTLLILPLVGAGCASSQTSTPVNSISNPTNEVVIEYRDGIFTPNDVSVRVGTTVTFKNLGSGKVWPASDNHPTHLLCPGFDARHPLSSGESYSFTFTKIETCPFHNHLSVSEIGQIVVNQ